MKHLAYLGGIAASLVISYLGCVLALHMTAIGYTPDPWISAARMFGMLLGILILISGLFAASVIARAWAEPETEA